MANGLAVSRNAAAVGCVILLNAVAFCAFAAPPVPANPRAPTEIPAPVLKVQPAPVPLPAPTFGAPAKPWGKITSDKGQVWQLTKPEITIGSDVTSDVVLADPTIAPHHCRITFAGGNAAVEDLGSKSGTLVAGAALKPGQSFKVLNAVEIDPGAVTLQFVFLERGTVAPSQAAKTRKVAPKVKVVLPPKARNAR